MRLYLRVASVFAPGHAGWTHSFTALRSQPNSTHQPLTRYQADFLPANERRRLTPTISFALQTAQDLWTQYQQHFPHAVADDIAILLLSTDGDTETSYRLCEAILRAEPRISPTLFHNSVHNAAAGYWMIGQSRHTPSTALATGPYSVAQALLEGYMQSRSYQMPVLFVSYDCPVDRRLPDHPAFTLPFSYGLIVSTEPTEKDLARLQLDLINQAKPAVNHWPDEQNPSAQAWPLLQHIAQRMTDMQTFPLSESMHLSVKASFT